jgi:hypothetical protein
MLAEHLPQRADAVVRPTQPQLDPGPQQRGVEPLLVEHLAGSGRPLARQVGQGGAAPQAACLVQHGRPLFVVVGAVAGQLDGAAELVNVNVVSGEVHPVPARSVLQSRRRLVAVDRAPQRPAQAGDVAVEGVAHRRGRLVAPDPVDQRLGRHGLVRVHEQGREHGALLGRTEVDGPAGEVQLNRAEQMQVRHEFIQELRRFHHQLERPFRSRVIEF